MSLAPARRHRKRKLKAEINVVPYIDVMLVLLIIFMVTAPLIKLGVDVKLPQVDAKVMETPKDPVIVAVDREGHYFIKLPDADIKPMEPEALEQMVRGIVEQNPDTSVLVQGDGRVAYEFVVRAMARVQAAGVKRVQLMSEPTQGPAQGAPRR